LDADICANFFQCIAIYPNGTMLRLSNGKFAIVKEQVIGVPFRPIIRLIEQNDGKNIKGEVIDLSKTLNITIIEDDPTVLAEQMK